MQVSAINNFRYNFKGFDDDFDNEDIIKDTSRKLSAKPDTDIFENVDFEKLEEGTKKLLDGKTDKKTSPIGHVAWTAILASGAFVAANKGARSAIKGLTSKLSLDDAVNGLAKKLADKAKVINGRPTGQVKSVKTFFTTAYNNLSKWVVKVASNSGKAGLTEAELKGGNAQTLIVRNAVNKAISRTIGIGAGAGVASEQLKDSNNDGKPDILQETGKKANMLAESLKVLNGAIAA